MVRLDAVVSAVAWEAGLDPDRNSQDKTLIVRFINDTRREIYEMPYRFSAMEFVGEFVGVANVTAGTVNATLNASEVTGTSTSFSTGMAGRYMSIGGAGQWQRVSFVTDATHLTLESAWNDATVTAQSYKIWQRDYPMPNKVSQIINIVDMTNTRFPLAYYDPSEFYQKYGFGDAFNPPLAYTQFNSSEIGYAYLGSTVYTGITTTANSPIVDFAATAGLVTGLAPGDSVTIGNSTTSTAFFVDKVLTDSKIVLSREFINVSLTSMSATAFSADRLMARFYPAIDNTKIYYYEAYKQFYNLLNNGDFLEREWYPAVKKGSIAKALGYVRDPREEMKLKEYAQEITTLIRNQYKAKNPAVRLKPHFQRRYGTGGFFGYFPSKYDIPG